MKASEQRPVSDEFAFDLKESSEARITAAVFLERFESRDDKGKGNEVRVA
jgi:hypothetical protein